MNSLNFQPFFLLIFRLGDIILIKCKLCDDKVFDDILDMWFESFNYSLRSFETYFRGVTYGLR